jgi:hypothetical protein
MRIVFSLAALIICLGIVSLVTKKQTDTVVKLPSTTGAESRSVKTTDLPKQIQQDIDRAVLESAKKLDEIEPKP